MAERDEFHDTRVSAAYRRGAGDEPPRAVDDAIRAMARREIGGRPGRRWLPVLASAAVLVLAVGTGLKLFLDTTQPAPMEGGAPAQPESAPQQGDRPASAPPVELPRQLPTAAEPPAAVPAPLRPSTAVRDSAAPEAPARPGSEAAGQAAGAARPAPATPDRAVAPCGVEELEGIEDQSTWRHRIEALRAAGDDTIADCLEQRLRDGSVPR
jgi:hypothetical protein